MSVYRHTRQSLSIQSFEFQSGQVLKKKEMFQYRKKKLRKIIGFPFHLTFLSKIY